MNCHELRDLLPLHLYGDLNDAERAAIDAHLSECPACRAELVVLGAVRKALDAPPEVRVDINAIYRAEGERLQKRARRWRIAAVLATAASVLFLASRLEVRADGRQLVVRWGVPEPAAPPTVIERTVVVREPVAAPEVDERIKTMSALIHALVVSNNDKDSEHQKELERLRKEVATLQQIRKRLGQTERDVAALYTAQFGSRPSGVNP